MEKKNEYSKLTVPNDISYGSVVGAYVVSIAKKIGFKQDEQQMIELGVDEAFTNVVEHAFEPEEDATFDIICERIPLGLKVAIRDKGLPFDPSEIPKYDAGSMLEEQPGGGLGVFLMKQTMDEVSFHNLGKQGKETQLIKFLKHKSIEEYFDETELKQFDKPFEEKLKAVEKIDFDIRLMNPSEAIEVSKCIYKTYGYSYDKENAYFPERIIELNDIGLMASLVAVTDDGEVAGHGALLKNSTDDNFAEFGMAVVKPSYRGHGCLKQLGAKRLEIATSQNLVGVFAQCVSVHPFSQKAIHKFDFYDCAILLANVPTTRSFRAIQNEILQRESYVIAFRYLHPPPRFPVYPPPHHLGIISKIYNNICYLPDFKEPESTRDPREDPSVFKETNGRVTTKINSYKEIAEMRIPEYGADVVRIVHRQLKDLCIKRIDTIYLYLDLRDPLTYHLTSEFEKLGFFFGGVFPGQASGSDALVLQYLNNVPMDYEKIAIASDFAQELKDYIEQHDPNKRFD